MIELDAVIGTLIGVVTGATPFVVSAFWRECRERRVERDRQAAREHDERQAAREHEERMLKLNNQRETVQLGIQSLYTVDVHEDSVAFLAPNSKVQRTSTHKDAQDRAG